jgi:hypothetical protein
MNLFRLHDEDERFDRLNTPVDNITQDIDRII